MGFRICKSFPSGIAVVDLWNLVGFRDLEQADNSVQTCSVSLRRCNCFSPKWKLLSSSTSPISSVRTDTSNSVFSPLHWKACQVQQHAVTTFEHCLLQALSEGILPSSKAWHNVRCRTIGGSQHTWFDSLETKIWSFLVVTDSFFIRQLPEVSLAWLTVRSSMASSCLGLLLAGWQDEAVNTEENRERRWSILMLFTRKWLVTPCVTCKSLVVLLRSSNISSESMHALKGMLERAFWNVFFESHGFLKTKRNISRTNSLTIKRGKLPSFFFLLDRRKWDKLASTLQKKAAFSAAFCRSKSSFFGACISTGVSSIMPNNMTRCKLSLGARCSPDFSSLRTWDDVKLWKRRGFGVPLALDDKMTLWTQKIERDVDASWRPSLTNFCHKRWGLSKFPWNHCTQRNARWNLRAAKNFYEFTTSALKPSRHVSQYHRKQF